MEMKVNSSSNYTSDTGKYTKKKKTVSSSKPTHTSSRSRGYILELSSEGIYRSQVDRSYKKVDVVKLGKKVLKKLTLPKALTAKMKKAIEAYSYQMAYSKRKEKKTDIYE